jgi:hypothetical protein
MNRATHDFASKKGQCQKRNDDEEEDRNLQRKRLKAIKVINSQHQAHLAGSLDALAINGQIEHVIRTCDTNA